MNIKLIEIKTFKQIVECVKLQNMIWGSSDLENVSPITLRVMTMNYPNTGLLIGIYYEEKMIGFAIYFITDIPNSLYGYILSILPEYSKKGFGFEFHKKLRGLCQSKKIYKIFWTFEPLEGANANLYINKLGAIGVKYKENYFRVKDNLNKGIPLDRLMLEWDIKSQRVINKMNTFKNYHYIPTQTNILMLRHRDNSCFEMAGKLKQKGIITSTLNISGIQEHGYIRIILRNEEDNDYFYQSCKELD